MPEEFGRDSTRSPGPSQRTFFLAGKFFIRDLILELSRFASGQLASYGKLMAFCPELIRNVEAKSSSERFLRFGSVLVEWWR